MTYNETMSTHNPSLVNLEKGVKERVLFVKQNGAFVPPPMPISRSHIQKTYAPAMLALRKQLFTTTPVSANEFVDMYRGRKRVVYAQAATSLETLPVERKDSDVRAFTKKEKWNTSLKPDCVPRVVSPRSPRYNVEVGRYLKPIEERLLHAIGKLFGEKVVFKGMNSLEQGALMHTKWSRFAHPAAIGLDASRFDQHTHEWTLEQEHSVYLSCFNGQDRQELAKLLSWQRSYRVNGYTRDGSISFKKQGGRCSGDMNTGLGNCLIACLQVYARMSSLGFSTSSYALINNGDDIVIIIEKKHLQQFSLNLKEWYLDIGYTMKVEKPVFVFEDIEFCQTHPVDTIRGILMVRHPRVALHKDSMCIDPLNTRRLYEEWIGSVAEGGLSLTGGVPVWQAVYSALKRSANGRISTTHEESGFWMLAGNLSPKVLPITDESRASFFLAFGITPDMQIAIENEYAQVDLSWGPNNTDIEYVGDWFVPI